jgi:hypothetical protein
MRLIKLLVILAAVLAAGCATLNDLSVTPTNPFAEHGK